MGSVTGILSFFWSKPCYKTLIFTKITLTTKKTKRKKSTNSWKRSKLWCSSPFYLEKETSFFSYSSFSLTRLSMIRDTQSFGTLWWWFITTLDHIIFSVSTGENIFLFFWKDTNLLSYYTAPLKKCLILYTNKQPGCCETVIFFWLMLANNILHVHNSFTASCYFSSY